MINLTLRKGNGKLIGTVSYSGTVYTFEEATNTRSLFNRMEKNGIDTRVYKEVRKDMKKEKGKFPIVAVLRENVSTQDYSTSKMIDGMVFIDVHSDTMKTLVNIGSFVDKITIEPYDFEPDTIIALAKSINKTYDLLNITFEDESIKGNSVNTRLININAENKYNIVNSTEFDLYPKSYLLVKR